MKEKLDTLALESLSDCPSGHLGVANGSEVDSIAGALTFAILFDHDRTSP